MQIAINHDPTDPTENRCHRFLAALHGVNYNVVGVVADDGGAAGGGVLTERYAYSPYGQRQVFGHGWNFADLNGDGRVDQLDLDLFDVEYFGLTTDDAQPGDLDADGDTDLDDRNRLSNALGWNHDHDPYLLTPRARSARVDAASAAGGVQQPYGLCRIGHQGLAHDEETSLIYNRARMRSVQLGRFLQRDPLGYVDGSSRYAPYHILHGGLDPTGLVSVDFYYGAFIPNTIGTGVSVVPTSHPHATTISKYSWFILPPYRLPSGRNWVRTKFMASTDDRSKAGANGTYRIRTSSLMSVDAKDIGSLEQLAQSSRLTESRTGDSYRIGAEIRDSHQPPSPAWRTYKYINGSLITSRGGVLSDDDETVKDLGPCKSEITVRADAAYPLSLGFPSALLPDIDYKITIRLETNSNREFVKVIA